MNRNNEIQKIKVDNGQELIAKAQEYKNSGGEWKLLERYFTMPVAEKEKGWARKNNSNGFIISNGKQTAEIVLEGFSEVNDFLCDKWEELCQLFPELLSDKIPWEEDSNRERIHCASFKRVKEGNKEYELYRYLVAEDFRHLRQIIRNYFRENEAQIYNSVNRNFSDWVEIIDGQNGNMYLYVGEKNAGGRREIKIGIKKDEYEKKVEDYKNRVSKERSELETLWILLTMSADQPLTPAEKEASYQYLEEEFQENWPHREKLCRKYWEGVAERMEEKGRYLEEKIQQKEYQKGEGKGIEHLQALARVQKIRNELKQNNNIKTCCDNDCPHALLKDQFSSLFRLENGDNDKPTDSGIFYYIFVSQDGQTGIKIDACHPNINERGRIPRKKDENGNTLWYKISWKKADQNKRRFEKEDFIEVEKQNNGKSNYPTPTSPKTDGTGKTPSSKNKQLKDSEKSQICQYLIKNSISKISLINGKLVIEYNNNTKKTVENEDQEQQKYHQLIENLPNKSLSLSELQNNNNSATPNKSKVGIYIGLTVGAFILGGIFVYFLVRKRKNK